MPHFILNCIDKADALDQRMATRQAHLDYVGARPDIVKLGGPLLDDAGKMIGSHIILEAGSKAEVEAFAANDPYGLAGVFESVTITEFRIVRGTLG
jgi:uncharacterized protein